MRYAGVDAAGAVALQNFRGGAESAGGLRHVIDEQDIAAFDFTDDVHGFDLGGADAVFRDDGEIGTEGIGLGNEEIAHNVVGALAGPVLGNPWHTLLYIAVLVSSVASLITTFLPSSRTMLGMATYKALPSRFGAIHPRYLTPSYATVAAGAFAGVFYTVMMFLSENALTDTIYSLGIMICFYYGLTAFACIWFFRHELFAGVKSFVFKLLFPLLGGLGLFAVLIVTLHDSASPEYGSGASVFGVGLVLVLGLGLILLGLVLMLAWRVVSPDFFRGETLRKDTPVRD